MLIFFMVFFSFVSCLAFYALIIGNWFGKRKVNVAQGEICGTQKVMQDMDESWCMSKHSRRQDYNNLLEWLGPL